MFESHLKPPYTPKVYGFHIDSTNSNPNTAITYIADAVGMTPAYMDYTNNKFEWGSWKDAFFMPKPCMLKSDGTVDYYLDPDDYLKKADGTPSDVADDSYDGNAMMEWGRDNQRIWYKIVPDDLDSTNASIYISNQCVNNDYRAWSFINADGQMTEHFYTPIYNGTLDGNGKLRSISGKTYFELCQSKNVTQEVAAAEKNNPVDKKIWYTEQYCDITLINILLILMSKSLDTQTAFGKGRSGQPSGAQYMLGTGTMDKKGMFWGSSSNNDGMKVFGMENYWGNQWRRFAGLQMNDYQQLYKMTRSMADGSSTMDYNQTGSGYLQACLGPNESNYISKMWYNKDGFFDYSTAGNSSSKYYCDYWYPASGLRFALRGGASYAKVETCGAFYVYLYDAASAATWYFGAAVSCKPLL